MNKRWFLIIVFLLIPLQAFAIDLSKGLQESPENLKAKASFLRNGASLTLAKPELYPLSIFVSGSGSSIKVELDTDKKVYQAGDRINLKITVSNEGFFPVIRDQKQEKKLYYLWSDGNFELEINRTVEEVKDGEVQLASGTIFDKNEITLLQKEKKSYDFFWEIPANTKSGTYEIRVYPLGGGMLLQGNSINYWSPYKTRISIEGNADREEKVDWDLGRMKIDDQIFRLKDKANYLDADKNYRFFVPLRNNGSKKRDLVVIKKIFGNSDGYESYREKEEEKVTLEPGEERLILFEIKSDALKNDTQAGAQLSYYDVQQRPSLESRWHFDYPVFSAGTERLIIPFYVKGSVGFFPVGMGINTLKDSPGFTPGSKGGIFFEVHRWDTLFYWSAGKEREPEENIKIDLFLLDKDGNKIEEAGYEGPSWNRTAQVSKLVTFGKEQSYLKLVGVLSVAGKGEVARKELEYRVPREHLRKSLLVWAKEWVENNLKTFSILVAVVLLAGAGILTIVFVLRKRNKSNDKPKL